MTIQNLHNLIHQLTSQEQTLIRYALKGTKEEGENKYRQLFDFVARSGKNISRQAASMAIYQASADTRINKLIVRLWEKVLDIITSDNFLRKNTRLTERSLLRISTRKKLMQCITLGLLNGNSKVFDLLIEQGIKDGEESEYYLLLVELYQRKKNYAVFKGNIKEYRFCERRINYVKNCLRLEEKLLDYYNELTLEYGYGNRLSPAKKIKYLEKVLADLKRDKKYIVSVYANYTFFMIELEYLFYREDYVNARKLLRKLLHEFGSSPLDTETDITARIESELTNCELLCNNYNKAVKHAEKSISMLRVNKKMNYYLTLELLFLSVFFCGDFVRAEKIVAELQSDKSHSLNDFRIAKPYFYQACIHFKKDEYKQALQIINKAIPLNKDKTGYDIAIRVLKIKCLVELTRFDEATMQIENLRRHVSRNHKKTYTSERDKLITRTLVLMQKRGFAGKPGKAETELASKLSLPSGKYKWGPMTPELIRFHEWYKDFGKLRK